MRKKRQAGSTPVEEKREEKRFRANSVQKKKKKKSTSPSKNKFLTLGVGDKDEVELGLEARVFGGVANVVERLAPDDARDSSDAEGGGDEGRAPAWQDEDDDISAETAFRMQGRRASAVRSATGGFSECLRKKFQAVVGTPEWAKLGRQRGSDSDAESDEDLLRRCGRFVVKKGSELGTGTIDIQRVRDLNVQTYAEGPIIKAVQFHPSSTVGLVAGMAGIVSLFQVDGHTNAKLHSIQFERFPIACARFTRDGNQFLAGSQKHRHLFYHDLLSGKTTKAVPFAPFSELSNMKNFEMSPDGRLMALCGRFGYVHVMTVRSRELVAKLKMDGEVTAVAFSPDGSRLYSHGDGGQVYVWGVASRACEHRFTDDGCVHGSSLAVSPCGRLLACGSRSGVVNLYDTAAAEAQVAPRPLKAFPNLTTAASALRFDSSSQLLAAASSEKESAAKLAHLQSRTVYSNFPLASAKVFRVQCLAFSLNSGFLALGNNRNAALLYRLKSFGNY
ncbi:U3 small nucleolar RNA-associated protein 18 homolog isoform X2 [Bacillus rossius redtenbacheri]|uniref:U3 small nucleolar RNA-associated protein 18 homolog isoform X2 n=1 Tax=Bacillus rossius redtenbacheri TaxID=93214 RepID=UPI002FDCEFE5